MAHMSAAVLARDLEELARNLWWSWGREALALWTRVAEEVPASSRVRALRNPAWLAAALRPAHYRKLAADSGYRKLHRGALTALRQAAKRTSRIAGLSWKKPVAYFSMEFGVHESLPIYCGGLGLLAGDHLKSASDLGVPLVGIGLVYHRGYYSQQLSAAGRMRVTYPALDPTRTALEAVKTPSGRPLRLRVEFPDGAARVKLWRLRVGQVPLYLLDTDIPENQPRHRRITHYLYGGSREDRLRQEVLLGIGGVRALEALGIEPGAWHLNEGHVAFLSLERLRGLRRRLSLSVPEALEALAANSVFTTHTPVPEGNETFDLALVRHYAAEHCEAAGMQVEEYLELGLDHAASGTPVFSMTVLALALSRFRGGVSQLHGQVARHMWSFLWPAFRDDEVPIGCVTNGVHTRSWVAPQIAALFDRHLGDDWTARLGQPPFWKRVRKIPAGDLWRVREELRAALIQFVREREDRRLERGGWSRARRQAHLSELLTPEALTIGFARRFALYKRAALIFSDLERAARLFGSTKRPVQIIFAGKPHPEDPDGKKVYEQVARISRRREFRHRVVVLEDYDIEVCRHMVHGVDVWLNNPRRPLEASGTSGQKSAVNGGLNVSILDGWWQEAYAPETGWAFGKPAEYTDLRRQDADDVASLYRVLEREVIPLFYDRPGGRAPTAWVQKIKSSMAILVPQFSSDRMVLDYTERFYLPAQAHGKRVLGRRGAVARELSAWKAEVSSCLSLIHLRRVEARTDGSLRLEVFLGALDPRSLVCWNQARKEHKIEVERVVSPGVYLLNIAGVTRGAEARRREYRVFPTHPALAHPQELGVALEFSFVGGGPENRLNPSSPQTPSSSLRPPK